MSPKINFGLEWRMKSGLEWRMMSQIIDAGAKMEPIWSHFGSNLESMDPPNPWKAAPERSQKSSQEVNMVVSGQKPAQDQIGTIFDRPYVAHLGAFWSFKIGFERLQNRFGSGREKRVEFCFSLEVKIEAKFRTKTRPDTSEIRLQN